MQQLLLNISTHKPPTLETFVTGRNEELLHLLRRFAQRAPGERFAYLWGEEAVGKTHLLRALAQDSGARYIGVDPVAEDFGYDTAVTLYLLDDCERLSPQAQIAAFDLFNQVRENGGFMLTAGSTAPAQLPVRDDLKSRMSWGLAYRVHGLSDDEKLAALEEDAKSRGLALSPGVLPYLITHCRRDMHSLSVMLDALDRYSLETQRAVTLPLLLGLLQRLTEEEPKQI